MNSIFNYSDCLKEAQECKSRSEFAKKNRSAYITALNNGWLKDYTWFVRPAAHNKMFWSKEKCYEEAKKYASRKEFHDKNASAYSCALKKGWINDYTWLSKPQKWNKEKCEEEARKYETMYEFRKGSPSAYTAARKNGFLSDFDWFVRKPISEMREYVVYELKDEENKAVYVGVTCDINQTAARRNMAMKKGKMDSVAMYFVKAGKNIPKPNVAKGGMTQSEAQSFEWKTFDEYKKKGWHIINDNNSADDKSIIDGFLGAIMTTLYRNYMGDDDKVCTKCGFYVKFRDFNEWGDENPLYYGVDVYNSDNELVCSEKVGEYCGFSLNLLLPDSKMVLELMAKDLAVKCGAIDTEPLPF